MLLSALLVLGLSLVVNGRKFHKHERYHLYKKGHISGAHRSLVFDIPDHVNKGKKGCKHDGVLRKHGEVWSPGPCIPECHCINGEVTCSKLECPDLNCEKTIKRKWKCCPECPPITERNGDKCGVRTIDGNANSSCCNFPFRYNGVLYYTCTYQHNNKPWCAVTANYDRDGVWGTCIDEGKTKKKFHPVNSKFQDEMKNPAASLPANTLTNSVPKILPSLTVNSLSQGRRPMPALGPNYLNANVNQNQANAAAKILPFTAIRERISSIWKKIGFKKKVYNMLSKGGGQTVTVALPNGGFLPKAGQSYFIPEQYMRPIAILPKGGNVVNAGNVNAANANNNAVLMSKIIVNSITSMIAPSSTTQVTMASQIVNGQQGSSGNIVPSKVVAPQASLTTPVISGQGPGIQVTTPNPGTAGQGTGSQVTTPNPGATGQGTGSQVTTPNPGATGQGTGSQVTTPSPGATTPKPTTAGQGNGTQTTTVMPTTAPQGNGSEVTTPKPTGNVTTQSDAVTSNAQLPAPSNGKSLYRAPQSPSDMPANVSIIQNLQKQRNFGASNMFVAQQQPWSPTGGLPTEPLNATSQSGGQNVSIATQTFTPLPSYFNATAAPQVQNNGSFGLPNIVPTTKPTSFVWPNMTQSTNTTSGPFVWPNMTQSTNTTSGPFVWPNMTQSTKTTSGPFVWPNMTQSTKTTSGPFVWPNATAKPPVVWPNMTGPPINTTTAPPVSGQNVRVFALPPVNTTTAGTAKGNKTAVPEVMQTVFPTGNTSGLLSSVVSQVPIMAVNTSKPAQSTNFSSNQASNPYGSPNTYITSNSYSNSNSYSKPNSSNSDSTYTNSGFNRGSNDYSSSNPYNNPSSYSDLYQQQQDQTANDNKAKQSEDSSKTNEKQEKEEDNPSAHLYEYMTMQPPSEPLVPDPYEAQRRAAQQARELAEAYNNYLKNFYASHGYGG